MKLRRSLTLGFALAVLCGTILHDAFSYKAASAEQRAQQQGRRQGRQGRGRGRQRQDANALKVGQMAPTFELMSLDGESKYDLKASRGEKPVVLFFGSYT